MCGVLIIILIILKKKTKTDYNLKNPHKQKHETSFFDRVITVQVSNPKWAKPVVSNLLVAEDRSNHEDFSMAWGGGLSCQEGLKTSLFYYCEIISLKKKKKYTNKM